ncbi:unnamed protein product [Trichogramma brassicae]|uniref:Uncharacterized protein n=1 Tax=Trichogramma brassicae TaxID=86971 RepID=A0A6H5IPQ6_9HYME|nr:unnamed protein product [Trichogramma brassicae]
MIGNWVGICTLFDIYDRFDLNYTNESGFTHFHAACVANCEQVTKFLELGYDPNLLVEKSGDSPLHVAVANNSIGVAELLLRRGSEPNLANAKGRTPLHIFCKNAFHPDDVETFFATIDDIQQTLQLDARTKRGDTPLHLATHYNDYAFEPLVRRGADPNLANENGLTPLHVICSNRWNLHEEVKILFEISHSKYQPLRVDARDKLGRTPLQLDVTSLSPDVIDVLLDNDADLSSFVFPTENDFDERWTSGDAMLNFKLRLASGMLACVERLEKRGYELDRGDDALTIMKLFVKHGSFDELSANLDDDHWYTTTRASSRKRKKS